MTVYDVARRLPEIVELRALCRAVAALEIVLSPDDDTYYRYTTAWASNEELASMRNGSGDEFDVVFTAAGAYIRGFDHESPMSPYGNDDEPWPGVLDAVPEVFRECVEEPAFTDEFDTPCVTVCLWREHGDTAWQHGDIDFPDEGQDGADWMFRLLTDRTPEAFQDWAQDYYEMPVDLDAVRHFYEGRPVTAQVVAALNPGTELTKVLSRIAETGYPVPRETE
ncbi:hypothetical protein [Lentzea sp. NPDC003310]|uniref:hypothetical protein n=1 Tax=Lentzea sp. NPDC003310 TaxID=3154447 RepID=UPI0033AF1EA7